MKVTPKYSFEMLYVSPFTKKLGFDEKELKNVYVPIERIRHKTGMEVVDLFVDRLVANQDTQYSYWDMGLSRSELSMTMRTLTGMTPVELRTRWRTRLAGELLRYTELPLREVMSRCGYTSQQSFSRFIRKAFGTAPAAYRRQCRARGDVGKYAL